MPAEVSGPKGYSRASGKEALSMEAKFEKLGAWLREHRWEMTLVILGLALLGWAMPLYQSVPVTLSVLTSGEEYAAKALSETPLPVWLSTLFDGGTNWTMVLLLIIMPVLSILLAVGGKFRKGLMVASSLLSLVLGVLLLISPSLYDIGESLTQLGGAEGGLAYWTATEAMETELDAGAIVMMAFSFFGAAMSLASASERETLSVRNLAEIAVMSALAIALQFIRIPIGETGGSINLGLVPLAYLALRHGPAKGFVAGAFVYGLVTCLTDGYGLYTYPYDYLVGFGSIAVFGFFRPLVFPKDKPWTPWGFLWIFLAAVLQSFVRFVGGTVSSMVNYGYDLYAACAYNVVYVFVTGAVTAGVILILYPALGRLEKILPVERGKGAEGGQASN